MAVIRQRNNRYQALVRISDISTSKTFTRKSDAEKWARATEVSIESGNFFKEQSTTVRDALHIYRDGKIKHDKSSYPHINNAAMGLGHIKIDNLSSRDLVKYRNKRLETHNPQTVKHELSMVLRALRWLRDEEGYTNISIPTVKMPQIPTGRTRRLSLAEQDKLIKSLSGTHEASIIVQLAIETGMRRSEIINIDWADINFRDKTLHIPITKTNSPRIIPLTTKASNLLSAMPRNISGKVFNIKAGSVSQAFLRACKRSGLEDLRFHDLRHEAVSRFFEMGLNVMEVASISGHKDLRMLQRYTHLKAEDLSIKINGVM